MVPDRSPAPVRLQSFTLGDWLVDPRACHVSRGETVVKLRAQLVDLLVCLARRAGEIVLKDEILAEVWPGQFIAESGLSRCIAELRQILQDDAQHPRYIETITKRGYRLVAPVVWLAPEDGTQPDGETSDAGAPPKAEASRAARGRWIGPAGIAALLVVGLVVTVLLKRAPARALLTERDPVVLAFENRTGDKVFDDTIPLAVSIQLEQSPYLALLSPARIQEVLGMMKRPPDTLITRAVGLELCERAGGRAVIVTSISQLGAQYVIGFEAVACDTGGVLARRQVAVDRKERVLDGLQRAAEEIRQAVGEPSPSLARHNAPIVEGTTASLEALRALRLGDTARTRGEWRTALDLYRSAVSLDPDFALAQLRRGRAAEVAGTEAESREGFEKAFALRGRVTLPERLEIELTYHRFRTGDQAKIFEVLDQLRRAYPRRAWIRQFLSAEYAQTGRHEAALAEALEAQRLEPGSARVVVAVGNAYLFLNRVGEARAAGERALKSADDRYLHLFLFRCAVAQGDQGVQERERAWVADHVDVAAPEMMIVEADESLHRGRLDDALRFLRKYEAWARAGDRPTAATNAVLWMARFEALAGFRVQALRRLNDVLRRGIPPEATIQAAKAAVSAGDFDLAVRLIDRMASLRGHALEPDATLMRSYRAAAAARRGHAEDAQAQLAVFEPLDLGFQYEYIPLFERAQVHYLAGNWEMARAAFEKILAHPNIGAERKLLPLAQLGLARTLARAGDVAGSRRTYEQLFDRWREADPGLPVHLEARREYAALSK